MKTRDIDFSMYGGYSQFVKILIEMNPGSFAKYFVGKSGYLYTLSPKTFCDDTRLGLRGIEFISREPVKIVKKKLIKDLWKTILNYEKKGKITTMTFKDFGKYIGKFKK